MKEELMKLKHIEDRLADELITNNINTPDEVLQTARDKLKEILRFGDRKLDEMLQSAQQLQPAQQGQQAQPAQPAQQRQRPIEVTVTQPVQELTPEQKQVSAIYDELVENLSGGEFDNDQTNLDVLKKLKEQDPIDFGKLPNTLSTRYDKFKPPAE